ncbi:MAG: hypothetical protein P1P82_16270 [Bacteroidales bacterium]|nr:hypothetical protein [Bacteroidales bacterium]MDT8432096.1 hypothetical protein [Bacteroidales bacterium]
MDKKLENLKFALVKITTEQFALLENDFDEESDISIQVNFRFGADSDKHIIAVFSAFTFETKKTKFLTIEAGCHFAIPPESWEQMLDRKNNKLIVPKGLLQHMAVITVGTTRGILHSKTENTEFNKYHLPTINLQNMITTDNVFSFEKIEESK